MRIGLVLSQQLGSTGSGIFTANIASGLAELGHSVSVLAFGVQPGLDLDRRVSLFDGSAFLAGMTMPGMSDVMPYPTRQFSSLTDAEADRYFGCLLEAVTAFAASGFDVLHVNHLWLAAAATASVHAGPLCITVHGTDLAQFGKCPRLVERFGLRALDRFPVQFPSRRVAELARALGLSPVQWALIPVPYREDIFFPPENAAPRAGSVCVGKLSDEKGIWELAGAYRLLSGHYPRHRLTLVGAGAPWTELAPFFETADGDTAGPVTASGVLRQAELAALFRESKILICPSWSEGFSLVCLEAAASGMTVIMPRFGAVDDQLAEQLPSSSLYLVDPLRSTDGSERVNFASRLAQAWCRAEANPIEATSVNLRNLGRIAVARALTESLYATA